MNLNNWTFDTLPTVFIIIFFPLFIYVTYWFFITGLIGLYRMIQSKNWRSTIGEITHAEIKFKDFSSDGDTSFKFIIEKEYSYTVKEQQYTSKQTLPSDSLYAKEFKPLSKFPERYGSYTNSINYVHAEKELQATIGRSVKVFYDGKKPQISCLITGINNEIFLPIFMGFIFGCGITYLTYIFVKPLFE
ncbi:DUF3592 domain-containing protein [Flavobacterium sp. LC2016-01]|uniref:DUF3592 domain-containing protein n=1 Tax=Flavobacterium sp. LC2016-01 TaxID=2675876 RepID=UPI0012BA7E31|nr:DUF3592 domain-containing protein [Flavobacterium sp. LC2016-01]MTH15488.1 DUF3592 domain-containing protein [Flavobacterium sp. LC2016-01]